MAIVVGIDYKDVPQAMAERVSEWGGLGCLSDGLLFQQNNPNNLIHVCVFNHHNNSHYYLEKVLPQVGDEGLVFVDFKWNHTYAHQYAVVTSWASYLTDGRQNEFVRFKIEKIDEYGYCKVNDGYNKGPGGSWRGDMFYKVNKISRI
jgi:hypothetical protein